MRERLIHRTEFIVIEIMKRNQTEPPLFSKYTHIKFHNANAQVAHKHTQQREIIWLWRPQCRCRDGIGQLSHSSRILMCPIFDTNYVTVLRICISCWCVHLRSANKCNFMDSWSWHAFMLANSPPSKPNMMVKQMQFALVQMRKSINIRKQSNN